MSPAIVAPMVSLATQLRTRFQPSHSKTAGLNSMNCTVR
jgi:hypothetical protein